MSYFLHEAKRTIKDSVLYGDYYIWKIDGTLKYDIGSGIQAKHIIASCSKTAECYQTHTISSYYTKLENDLNCGLFI